MQLTDWAIILPTALGTSGIAGLIFQRKKTKAEAERGVVDSAEGVLGMYNAFTEKIIADNVDLRARLLRVEQNLTLERIRCDSLERAVRAAGIDIP